MFPFPLLLNFFFFCILELLVGGGMNYKFGVSRYKLL